MDHEIHVKHIRKSLENVVMLSSKAYTRASNLSRSHVTFERESIPDPGKTPEVLGNPVDSVSYNLACLSWLHDL
jgi:hypothetical protein